MYCVLTPMQCTWHNRRGLFFFFSFTSKSSDQRNTMYSLFYNVVILLLGLFHATEWIPVALCWRGAPFFLFDCLFVFYSYWEGFSSPLNVRYVLCRVLFTHGSGVCLRPAHLFADAKKKHTLWLMWDRCLGALLHRRPLPPNRSRMQVFLPLVRSPSNQRRARLAEITAADTCLMYTGKRRSAAGRGLSHAGQ